MVKSIVVWVLLSKFFALQPRGAGDGLVWRDPGRPPLSWLSIDRALGWWGFPQPLYARSAMVKLIPLEDLRPDDKEVVEADPLNVTETLKEKVPKNRQPPLCALLEQVHTRELWAADSGAPSNSKAAEPASRVVSVSEEESQLKTQEEDFHLLGNIAFREFYPDIFSRSKANEEDECDVILDLLKSYQVSWSTDEIFPMSWWRAMKEAIDSIGDSCESFVKVQQTLGLFPIPQAYLMAAAEKSIDDALTLSGLRRYIARPDRPANHDWALAKYDRLWYRILPSWYDMVDYLPDKVMRALSGIGSKRRAQRVLEFLTTPITLNSEEVRLLKAQMDNKYTAILRRLILFYGADPLHIFHFGVLIPLRVRTDYVTIWAISRSASRPVEGYVPPGELMAFHVMMVSGLPIVAAPEAVSTALEQVRDAATARAKALKKDSVLDINLSGYKSTELSDQNAYVALGPIDWSMLTISSRPLSTYFGQVARTPPESDYWRMLSRWADSYRGMWQSVPQIKRLIESEQQETLEYLGAAPRKDAVKYESTVIGSAHCPLTGLVNRADARSLCVKLPVALENMFPHERLVNAMAGWAPLGSLAFRRNPAAG